MAPAALGHEHEFLGTAGNAATCNNAFLASLTADGHLRIRNAHILATMLPSLPDDGAGHRAISLRQIFYALMDRVVYDDYPMPFVPRPTWLGHFVRSLCARGMPTTAVSDILVLRVRVNTFTLQLNVAERTLAAGDRVAITPAAPPAAGLGWFHSVTTGMLSRSE